MTETDNPREEYLALRESVASVQLATLSRDNTPEASYAPCVWIDGDCWLYLSRLSSHCANLERNPNVSLLLIGDASKAPNAFARQRASLHGTARVVARDDARFTGAMRLFHERFGKVMQIIEPLPDFRLFRITATAGSFIRGFGQAYRLCGAGLDRLEPVDPRK